MKKLKNEKGAITILVLVSILFMVSFLISSYAIVANKVKAQKEMIEQTRAIYDNTGSMDEIYNSFFIDNVIPIYTVEQLLAIGTDENIIINGEYYKFSNNDSTMYILMNDLKFNAYDYGDNYYWSPINDRENLLLGFNGNKHKIEVKYKDSEGDEYTVTYSEENNFSEPEYKVKISPRALSVDGEILSEATIYTDSGDNSEFIAQEAKGEIEIFVKRLVTIKAYAGCEGYRNSGTETITIENPNKIPSINLILGKYTFTITATPSNARVTINGVETSTVSVNKGEQVSWKVEATGYVTKEGTHTVEDDTAINVSLEVSKHTFTINATPSNAIVTIDGVQRNSITVDYGTTVSYSVTCDGYYTKQSSINVYEDTTINVNLELWNYIDFSESFYFARTSNSDYSGLLNGGSATVSKYDLTGGDYDMGTFYVDETDIVKKIPLTATISKVTVYFQYYQERDNTFLYTNRIKTKIYAGSTEKMSEQETTETDTTVRQATYKLTNITREELKKSLGVKLVNYIEGTMKINSTVKNLYCVIEGSYPDI